MSDDGPSPRALAMLERARILAQAEVDKHLAEGRPVYGRDQRGNPILVRAYQLELAQQVMDWEGPARP